MEGRALQVVHGLKYGGWQRLAEPMARSMARAAIQLARPQSPALVPVPLSRARRRERGFNQAQLLAAELSRRTMWPVAELIRRLPGGRPQARLGRAERASNTRTRFTARPDLADIAPTDASAHACLLVDDVLTTGATAAACARALAEAGLPCLGVVTFARAVGRFDH
jgi:ComF family protein